MHASRWKTKSLATLVAGIVVSLSPGLALADKDHDRDHDRKHRREHRDERRSECRDDRRDDRRSDNRYEGRRDGHGRNVRYVEVRRPAPRFTVGVQVGNAPYCAPVRAYCPPPAPVYYEPAACGAYYDPYCQSRYSNFELFVEHLGRNHAVSVSVRN